MVHVLATVIDEYIKRGRDVPLASARVTKHRVAMPALVALKVQLYEAMRQASVRKSELARRLDWHQPQVDRLLAMKHGSRLEQIEAAFRVLGKRLIFGVEDIAAVRPDRQRRRTSTRHQAALARDRSSKHK